MRQKQQSAAAKKEGGPSGEAGASGGKKWGDGFFRNAAQIVFTK